MAEGRKDALLPWEEALAESTTLCKALGEFAMQLSSPEDAPCRIFKDIYIFTEFKPPLFKVQLKVPKYMG